MRRERRAPTTLIPLYRGCRATRRGPGGFEVPGITAANARAMAESGADCLSSGALTHSAPAIDISLEFL
jgi:hypothetical protein